MNDFGFSQGFDALDFGSFGGAEEVASGPYIPPVRDCLSCGMCLGKCPTYQVRPEESYGPRGRLRMIERVIRKQEVLGEEELTALDACTLCRACEAACPSKMAYAELYLQAWEAISERPKRNLATQLVLALLEGSGARLRLTDKLIRFYQWSGLPHLQGKWPMSSLGGGFRELAQLLPVPHQPQAVDERSEAESARPKGTVGLFTGCVAKLFDTQTHNATIKLLTRLGYAVELIEQQACCGATYAHNGEPVRARECAEQNLTAFAGRGYDAIIYNASGCGAFLGEYPQLLGESGSESLAQEMPPVTDILDFLLACDWPEAVEFEACPRKLAVHEPCSQRNVLANADAIYELLARIPGLEVLPLPGNEMCCGAGGTKMLSQPELATPPRDDKVDALLQSQAELLISTNLTCALHLASGIRQAGREIEVMHPVRLLAQQLT